MKKSEFLIVLEDILQREDSCLESDDLNSYVEWDSLSKMAIMTYFDLNFGIKMTLNDLKSVNYVSDLVKIIGDKIDD